MILPWRCGGRRGGKKIVAEANSVSEGWGDWWWAARPSMYTLLTTWWAARPTIYTLLTTWWAARPSVYTLLTTWWAARPSLYTLLTTVQNHPAEICVLPWQVYLSLEARIEQGHACLSQRKWHFVGWLASSQLIAHLVNTRGWSWVKGEKRLLPRQ